MEKPARYLIGYEDDNLWRAALERAGGDRDAVDLADVWQTEDAGEALVGAISMARARQRVHRVTVTVYERIGLRSRHPYDDYPRFTDWDRDEQRIVGEVTDGKWTRYD